MAEVEKLRALASVKCQECGRAVGVAWFGGQPRLVDPKAVVVEGPGGMGYALMLHRCPASGSQIPEVNTQRANDLGPARRNGFNRRKRPN